MAHQHLLGWGLLGLCGVVERPGPLMKAIARHRWAIGFAFTIIAVCWGFIALKHEAKARTDSAEHVAIDARRRLSLEAQARENALRRAAAQQSARVAHESLARDFTICVQINDLRRNVRRLALGLVQQDGVIDARDLHVLAIVYLRFADKPCPPNPDPKGNS